MGQFEIDPQALRRGIARSPVVTGAMSVLACIAVLTGCATEGIDLSPQEAREGLVGVVYASGDRVSSLSFHTEPGLYGISGTSVCVPGDADELRGGSPPG